MFEPLQCDGMRYACAVGDIQAQQCCNAMGCNMQVLQVIYKRSSVVRDIGSLLAIGTCLKTRVRRRTSQDCDPAFTRLHYIVNRR